MTDKEYRQYIERIFRHDDNRRRMIWLASGEFRGLGFRRRLWLRLMGLMETWDIIK